MAVLPLILSVALWGLLGSGSARSLNCLEDIDLADVQDYTYAIPKLPSGSSPGAPVKGRARKWEWETEQQNFYIFGRFAGSAGISAGGETTIHAGLYTAQDKLVYETRINCDKGTWENWSIQLRKEVRDEAPAQLVGGELESACSSGEVFDVILKVNNYYAMNWMFDGQPLQHETISFTKKTGKNIGQGSSNVDDDESGGKQTKNVTKPLVNIYTRYNAWTATKLVIRATGSAVVDRIAFGQCAAWPKQYVDECLDARTWVFSRSKANVTEETLASIKAENAANAKYTNGLGVFGNNRYLFGPNCISTKYFQFYQEIVHRDVNIPRFYAGNGFYCCCTNMHTGRVLDDNPDKYCYIKTECHKVMCEDAYDPIIGVELFQEEQAAEHEGED